MRVLLIEDDGYELRFRHSFAFGTRGSEILNGCGGVHFPHATFKSEWGKCKPQELNRMRSEFDYRGFRTKVKRYRK